MGKCKFNAAWLDKKDLLGYKVNEWAQRKSPEEIWCNVCDSSFSCSNGWTSIEQHVQGNKNKNTETETKHSKFAKEKLHPLQLRLAPVRLDSPSTSSNPTNADKPPASIPLYSSMDAATTAELIWVLKCVQSNYSFNSCKNIVDTFSAMFPNALPKNFSLGATKATYLLTDALSPYFKSLLIRDLSNTYYSVGYDETTNETGMKELQVAVRYWSPVLNRVTNQHLETFFIGHARADDIVGKLNEALDNAQLPIRKMVMLSKDGPNVNKSVENKMNELLKMERGKGLLDLGSCNIHILHNAFCAGLHALGDDAPDFIIKVHAFFDGWPSRWEDFQKIQRSLNMPSRKLIKHVPSRWLTLEPAAQRVIDLMPALKKYFLEFLPKEEEKKSAGSRLTEKKKYLSICTYLKSSTAMAELIFVVSSAHIFTRFTGFFQKDEPLIQILYTELQRLITVLLNRSCKPEAVEKFGFDEKVLRKENLLPAQDVIDRCNEDLRSELQKMNGQDKLVFANDMLKHYVSASRHVIKKSALANPLAKHFRCLRPDKRKSKSSINDITVIAKALPFEIDTGILVDEWQLLQTENDSPEDNTLRIDDYWNRFFEMKTVSNGEPKYPTVTAFVRCALACAHGSASLERGFSDSGRTLTPDRASMSERTLNATQTVKSALKLHGNEPYRVPITRELLGLARGAFAIYEAHFETERKKKEDAQKKQLEERERQLNARKLAEEIKSTEAAIKKDTAKLADLKKDEKEKQNLASKLFSEANLRLERQQHLKT